MEFAGSAGADAGGVMVICFGVMDVKLGLEGVGMAAGAGGLDGISAGACVTGDAGMAGGAG